MHHASAFHSITHINKSGGDNKRCDNASDALAATGFVLTGPTRSIALAIVHLTVTFFTFLFHDRFLCFESATSGKAGGMKCEPLKAV